jgi:hypothetical protein
MAFLDCVTTQAKVDKDAGVHADADVYKCALIVQANATDMDANATTFTGVTGQIATGVDGCAGYTAGGVVVARNATAANGGKSIIDFADPTFTGLTTPATPPDGYVIYNTSKSNKILRIGAIAPTSCTNGTLTITMPVPDATTGFIRTA